MNDLGLRYLVPGFAFWIPVILSLLLLDLTTNTTVANLVAIMLASGIAVGFLLHHSARTWTYDDEVYSREIRRCLHRAYDPGRCVLIDFRELAADYGVRRLTPAAFSTLFLYEEKKAVSPADVAELRFTEPVSDARLFLDPSYEYGRSISTVRYVLDVMPIALLWGLLFVPAALAVSYSRVGPPELRGALTGIAILLAAPVLVAGARSAARRRHQAASEYRARLLFTTLTQSRIGWFEPRTLLEKLPPLVMSRIAALGPGRDRLAIFDMDNTLLAGDVGELVLKHLRPQAYSDYLAECGTDPASAYLHAAQVLAEMDDGLVEAATRVVIEENDLRAKGPVKDLLHYLQVSGFDCRVVTASPTPCARVACEMLLGIDDVAGRVPRKILGIDHANGAIVTPAPIYDGKVPALRGVAGDAQPVLVVGDSEGDRALFAAFAPHALLLVVDNRNLADDLREHYGQDVLHVDSVGR